MGASALCTVDDANCFHMIRLELKTSVYEKHVSVKSTVTGCDVTTGNNITRFEQATVLINHISNKL